MKKILVTGGAGFVGSSICCWLKQNYDTEVIAFDNLKRRGSELILSRLQANGVRFIHGDIRIESDLIEAGKIDLLIDCAAEPSVLAGTEGSPRYVIDTNLAGTINCLETARKSDAGFIFLSTSRVYPIEPLSRLKYTEQESRFCLSDRQVIAGASEHGISEEFPLAGARSIYGATKLASELIFQEYIDSYKLPAVINRCGVLTGPWQMGKIDQGVIVLWVARHFYNKPLSYIGYGGSGKQLRDLLHVSDLCLLLEKQLKDLGSIKGEIFNVGGGVECSASLKELTELSSLATGNKIQINQVKENRANDIPIYISDCRKVQQRFDWKAQKSARQIIEEIAVWVKDNSKSLEPVLNPHNS